VTAKVTIANEGRRGAESGETRLDRGGLRALYANQTPDPVSQMGIEFPLDMDDESVTDHSRPSDACPAWESHGR
jgi:hypothetical protein